MLENIHRYERKWVYRNKDYLQLINSLLRSNFFFRYQFQNRKVNSIYFDDNKFSSIIENLDGINNKKKIRVRWYGLTNVIVNPVIEIKTKRGFQNEKKIISLKSFKNNNSLDYKFLKNLTQKVNEVIKSKKFYFPILSTHYNREYFISNNFNIRATVDHDLESVFIKNESEFSMKKKFLSECILELKYSTHLDEIVRLNLKQMTLRLSKNSKYINSFFNKNFFYV